MTFKAFTPIIAGAGLLAGSTTASAALLVNYEFTGGSKAQTSGDLTGGDAVTAGGAVTTGSGHVEIALGRTADSLANSIVANDYVGFVLTNNSATQDAELETLTLDWWFNSPNASGTQTYSIFGLSDVNGFTNGQQYGSRTLGEGSTPGVGFNAHDTKAKALAVSFDISSLGTLAKTESIEFRVYFADNRGTFSPDQALDNIQVNGTLVPEPGSLALLGLGGLLIARRRR